jgi:restriction endonuclease
MQFSEIPARRPYVVDGREIDGSVTIGDTTYLVECKFAADQSGAQEIDVFRAKVESKADNTMGIFVAISGFTSVAIETASGRKTPLLLLDHGHLYRVLGGISNFRDVVERVRRHSSQTSQAYLPVNKFDG